MPRTAEAEAIDAAFDGLETACAGWLKSGGNPEWLLEWIIARLAMGEAVAAASSNLDVPGPPREHYGKYGEASFRWQVMYLLLTRCRPFDCVADRTFEHNATILTRLAALGEAERLAEKHDVENS